MVVADVTTIPLSNLAVGFLPVLVVVIFHYVWSMEGWTAVYALSRMLIQLLLIGYVLVYIFEAKQPLLVMSVLCVMLLAASWISLRPIKSKTPSLYAHALISIAIGGGTTLALVTTAILQLDPWYSPRYLVPLAGMIFASSMNTVSLAAERFESETNDGAEYTDARRIALRTSLIPIVNSLFAVGLVSLPGMMTGQILSGVEPHVAARYQIMVMCMLFGSAGMSSICYLLFAKSPAASATAPS